jgi:PPP family 3-phenylpropionic acid transporter
MKKKTKEKILSLQGFYTLAFFGTGSITTLLSVYLADVEKLNGVQIGTILSIGPIITILFQPLWGIISDATNAPPRVLAVTTFFAGFMGFGYMLFHQYLYFLITAILVAIFQSAIIPISDSISLTYTTKVHYDYGKIRLFGSLGFGIAVFALGRLSEWDPAVIFYAFFISLALASVLGLRLPNETTGHKPEILSGMKDLFAIKKYFVFLTITFLIFGPNLANNVYFGIFVDKLGGSYTGIGIAFLIAVLSEIPFMRISGRCIDKWGLLPVAAIAGAVSMVRWFLYFLEPSLTLVYLSAVIQGLSIGLFIPAGLQYIREITPDHVSTTAITIYSAIGNGLGNWFCTFIGGFILEGNSIYGVYLFFAIMSVLGVILNLWLLRTDKKDYMIRKILIKKS